MKTAKTLLIGMLAIAILFGSCSVEKRHYRKGFNVEKKSKTPKTEAENTPVVTPTEGTKTDATPATTTATQTATVAPTGTNTSYSFSVVVGPRPDKKKVQQKHKPH